jgi:hypothetical protein
VPKDPPGNITRLVLGNVRHWNVPRVTAVSTVPILRQDGMLIGGRNQPQYDAGTGIYYMPGVDVPTIPENPTWDEACAALGLLIELLDEFPFTGPLSGAVSRSVALSGLITPLVRPP